MVNYNNERQNYRNQFFTERIKDNDHCCSGKPISMNAFILGRYLVSPTYMNRLCDLMIKTTKDNKTDINFLKNESKTMITVILVSQFPNPFILDRYLVL